eukprot:gene7290-11609_t
MPRVNFKLLLLIIVFGVFVPIFVFVLYNNFGEKITTRREDTSQVNPQPKKPKVNKPPTSVTKPKPPVKPVVKEPKTQEKLPSDSILKKYNFDFSKLSLPKKYPAAPFDENLKIYHDKIMSLLKEKQRNEINKFMKSQKDLKKFIFFSIDLLLKELSNEIKEKELFDFTAIEYGRKYGITIWGMDYHIATMGDMTDLLKNLGLNITIIDQSLSGHCHLTGTCASNLKWTNRPAHGQIASNQAQLRSFFEIYKNDPLFKDIDIFVNFYQAAALRLYMPFQKPIWQICAVRYELAQSDPASWKNLNRIIRAVASDPKNAIGGNNMWDAVYLNYFTGVPVRLFESYCGYTKVQYKYPTKRKEILIGPSRMYPHILQKLLAATSKSKFPLAPIRKLYPKYEFSNLIDHQAIIVIPYSISLMSIFEYYRMNLPMLFPSKKFMVDLDFKQNMAPEITWYRTFSMKRSAGSVIPKDKCSKIKYDPNQETSRESMDYWWQYADFYQFPHITYFDSFEEIPAILEKMNFKQISDNMKAHNVKTLAALKKKWIDQFNNSLKGQKGKKDVPKNYDEAMKIYNLDKTYC